MRKVKLLVLTLLLPFLSLACPVCEKNQPAILKGITHGAGPESDWDFVIIGATVVIVIFCAALMVFQIVQPGEKNAEHIKNSILK